MRNALDIKEIERKEKKRIMDTKHRRVCNVVFARIECERCRATSNR